MKEKGQGKKTNQNLQGRQRQSLTTSHQQTDVQQLSQHQLPWKDYPQFLLLCIKFHDMGYSSGQFGSAVYLLCPLPAPCSLQGCSMWGQSKKQRMLWCCASTAQRYLKCTYVINIALVTDLKQRTIWAAVRKLNLHLLVATVLSLAGMQLSACFN